MEQYLMAGALPFSLAGRRFTPASATLPDLVEWDALWSALEMQRYGAAPQADDLAATEACVQRTEQAWT